MYKSNNTIYSISATLIDYVKSPDVVIHYENKRRDYAFSRGGVYHFLQKDVDGDVIEIARVINRVVYNKRKDKFYGELELNNALEHSSMCIIDNLGPDINPGTALNNWCSELANNKPEKLLLRWLNRKLQWQNKNADIKSATMYSQYVRQLPMYKKRSR